MPRSGAEILAHALAASGATHAFHVPGEGILDLLDAIAQTQPGLVLVHGRHEAGMAAPAAASACAWSVARQAP